MAKASVLDNGFRAFNAKLFTTAGPYQPYSKTGKDNDPARYVARPGIDFLRPWLAIRNGIAFQWPLGLQGWGLTTDPTLGIHKYIGDNAVEIDVIHAGEEHITMTGQFLGDTAPALVQALREVVRRIVPREGKILYIPEILTHAQRVQVVRSEFSGDEDVRGRDCRYSIEFAIMGLAGKVPGPQYTADELPTTAIKKGVSPRTVSADSKHNTLRKIAAWKLGNSAKWRTIYELNELWFVAHSISSAKAVDYRIPLGTSIYY